MAQGITCGPSSFGGRRCGAKAGFSRHTQAWRNSAGLERERERWLDFSCQQHPLGSFPGEQDLRSSGRVPGKIGMGLLVPVHWCMCMACTPLNTHPQDLGMCTARLQECLWYVRAQLCQAWGSVLEPKCVLLCGLSVADSKHPACMPTWACVTRVRVGQGSVGGLHWHTYRTEAQFWNI